VSFFYEIGSEPIDSVNMNALNDPTVGNPHIAIIVYDERRKKVTLNVDGAEAVSENINPIADISKISRIEFGEGYIGNMNMMYNYATKFSIQERDDTIFILSKSNKAKTIAAKKDARGVLVSGVDREDAVQCRIGAELNNTTKDCDLIDYTVTLPTNATGPATVNYNASLNGGANVGTINCDTGYEGSSDLGYYFSGTTLMVSGQCAQQCSDVPVGAIGIASSCDSMLIVDRSMLLSAIADGSYDFKPSDSYTTHSNDTYTFANGANTIFTGQVTDMSSLFNGDSFSGDISNWDVSNVTNMYNMFYNSSGNPNISNWDVGNVTNMSSMFRYAGNFNSDLSGWNVGNVTTMERMFSGASNFNSDISDWNVSNVTNMSSMFSNASNFNSDISDWVVSSVNNMSYMFSDAPLFNSDISGWVVSGVTNMHRMFYNASNFNSDISGWVVSGVTDMNSMFYNASNFNSDISSWIVSGVTNMSSMFRYADDFDSDLSGWNVGSVTIMDRMFGGATSFDSDISSWNVSGVTNMYGMFSNATSFNSNISSWNMSSVADVGYMFYNSSSFNRNLSGWCVQSVTSSTNFTGGTSILSGANMPPTFGSNTNCS